MRIAVPTLQPGGLDAPVCAHFGHCEAFTIITLNDGQVAGVEIAPNGHLGQGSCGVPVRQLADARVEALLVAGIGMRPLDMLRAQGIGVYATSAATVGEAVKAFLKSELPGFDGSRTCGGGSGRCGSHGA